MVKFLKSAKRLKLKIASIFMLVLLLALEFSPFAVKAAAEKLQFYSAGSVPIGWDSYNSKNVFYSYSTLGGNIAYCMDYTCPVPSGTMTFSRYLSDQAMAILVHGYPYNSAATLGLANDEEAYFATQMALWEVLNRTGESHKAGLIFRVNNVTPKAGKEDIYARTTAVAARLVAMAEASPFSEIPTLVVNTESVTFSNIGTDVLIGPYYVRVDGIQVSTLKSISASLEGAPASARITDANGNDKGGIGNNDAVYVRMSGLEDTVSFRVNFHSDVDKVCGRIYTTGGAVQDYCIVDTEPVSMNQPITINWKKLDLYGQIRLTKVDQDDQPVSGAKFRLTNADTGEVMVESVTTGDDGVLTFYKLPQGNYTLTEIEAPYGYEVREASKNITVKSGEMSQVKMYNDRITGRIIVTKIDDANKPLANVTFEIYNYKGEPVTRITTGEDGKASANVGYGTYYFKEISCPAGYIMSDKVYEFKVTEENRTFYKTVTNQRYKGSLVILKLDDQNVPIPGVKFEITSEKGTHVIDLTTNAQGKCGVTNLPAGKYYYQEKEVPANYEMDTEKHEFSITENNQVIAKTVVNKKIRGSFKILKVNDDDRAIANVKFNILDSNKRVVDTLVTNSKGEAVSKELTPGTYYYKEVEVPSPYIIDSTEYKFEVTNSGELKSVKVVNHTAKGSLKINKYDSEQHKLANVKFNILDVNDKVVDTIVTDANGVAQSKQLVIGKYFYQEVEAPENVIMDTEKHEFSLTENGQIVTKTVINEIKGSGSLKIKKYDSEQHTLSGVKFDILDSNNNVVDTIVTDANGDAQSKQLPLGKYYYQEKEAPENVIMDTEKHEFNLTKNGQIVTKTVINEIKGSGSLKIKKYSSDQKTLSGVKFDVLDANGTVVDTIVTDKKGEAQSKKLPLGKYFYKEIEAPDHVVMDTEAHEFELTKNNQVITKTVVNKIKEAKLKIIKVDESDKPVAGVKFEILDLNKKVIDTMVTNEQGRAESGELTVGTYYYREVEAPAEFVIDKELHQFTIVEDGQDVIERVVNNYLKGYLKILKLEEGTTTPLKGAKFAVIDANKNVIEEIVTDENGYAQSKQLLYGTYYFKEIEAPKGYIIDSTEYKFTIENDGDVIESIVYNTKTRLPKTGGLLSDNMIIVLIVSLVSVVGYGFLKLISVKKEND